MPPQALSSPALASHYHSGRLRLCRLCRRQPLPPIFTAGSSDFVVFLVEAFASHYHSGRLRLCRLSRRNLRPPLPNPGTDHLLTEAFLGSPFHRDQQHTQNQALQIAAVTQQ